MSLADFILANMERILVEWERFARTIVSGEKNQVALRDHAQAIMRSIAEDMVRAQSGEEQARKSRGAGEDPRDHRAAREHGTARYAEGFSLGEMVSEFRALRASVIRLWVQDLGSADRADLDELTRFNEALDQALTDSVQKFSGSLDRSRELFLGILGHDLRNPLGAILNSAHYLLASESLQAGQIKAASAIQRSGKRLERMIEDLLDVARTRLGESLPLAPRDMDLCALCESIVEEARALHPEHEVRLEARGAIRGRWDYERLSQLVANLVENAVRHGQAGGPVTVQATAGEGEAILRVHNLGVPMSAATLRTIFEPLTRGELEADDRASRGGLGLGLYIAREIVRSHGGKIEAASSAQAGTTFTAHLPRILPPRKAEETRA